MTDREFESLKSNVWCYFCGIVFICALIVLVAYVRHYSHKVDVMVEKYADSCNCKSVTLPDGVVVQDCMCPVQPEQFEKEMEKTR